MNEYLILAMPVTVEPSAGTYIATADGDPNSSWGNGITTAAAVDDLLGSVLGEAEWLRRENLGPLMEAHQAYIDRYVRFWWVGSGGTDMR